MRPRAAGVGRFVFLLFSTLDASDAPNPSRVFFRANALSEQAVEEAALGDRVAPSIVYGPRDPLLSLLERLALLLAVYARLPGAGALSISDLADDVADCLMPLCGSPSPGRRAEPATGPARPHSLELAGPETLSHNDLVRSCCALRGGSPRPLFTFPLPIVSRSLRPRLAPSRAERIPRLWTRQSFMEVARWCPAARNADVEGRGKPASDAGGAGGCCLPR